MTTPRATYRVQLQEGFPFRAATALVPYLHQLGIDTLYLSPLFQARPGSSHGYDVTDPTTVNPELGGPEGLNHLFDTLRAHHMGAILDVVPNHMAADEDNRWWWDVLEYGPASAYADYFDIDWHGERRRSQLVLPFLGQPFGSELESGALGIAVDPRGFYLSYYDRKFPLAPITWRPILARLAPQIPKTNHKARRHLLRLWHGLGHKGQNGATPAAALSAWLSQHPETAPALHRVLGSMNGQVGHPASWSLLERILNRQPWRLVHYRTASHLGNYRRFFDINDLPAVRVENPRVFQKVHSIVFAWAEHPALYGLRIDHIDGLYDPEAYLKALSRGLESRPARDYLIVEKVLGPGETLPTTWPVAGTTGYDFLNSMLEVLLDPEGLVALTDIYKGWQDPRVPSGSTKELALTELFSQELERLVSQLLPIAARDRWGRDLPRRELRRAIRALTVSLPVYRTYLRSSDISKWDRRILKDALLRARDKAPNVSDLTWDFLQRVLFGAEDSRLLPRERDSRLAWVMRWQQLTGPVQAKGFEDTALYRYHRLTALNEVGGTLNAAGLAPRDFHRRMEERQHLYPHGLNATSTHDTKRSEDVRTRLGILSEWPNEWYQAVEEWHALALPEIKTVGSLTVPDANTEYLIWQTILGAWPMNSEDWSTFPERIQSYLQKAVREAKVHSSWIEPNLAYEATLNQFVDAIFKKPELLDTMRPFVHRVAYYGALSSLSQVLVKACAPGVPDFYQGSELWDLSLTDPDNRRPVDFRVRQQWLKTMLENPPSLGELLQHWEDGRVKLYVTYKVLQLRSRYPELFALGSYQGLEIQGSQSDHILAFARHLEAAWCLVVVPRHYARLTSARSGLNLWHDTSLVLPHGAPKMWKDALSGQSLRAEAGQISSSTLFSQFPGAVLIADDS